jgi:two-component system response regulator AgrA
MLKFVVCDDNRAVLDRLLKMLNTIFLRHDISASIVFSSTDALQVIDYIKNNKIDVLILDINLNSKLTGFDVADIVRHESKDIYFIFTTGHMEYVLMAYKYKTFDYLPKPIIDERLEETILRLIEDINTLPIKFVRLNNNKTIIKQNDINYIKKDGMKLVFCTNSREYETYSSFNKIKSCLPENFVRCHKSFVVNVNNINNIDYNTNIIMFEHNKKCFIGAKYKNNIMEVLENGNFSNDLVSVNYRECYSN